MFSGQCSWCSPHSPVARQVDFQAPDLERFPEFAKAKAVETVVRRHTASIGLLMSTIVLVAPTGRGALYSALLVAPLRLLGRGSALLAVVDLMYSDEVLGVGYRLGQLLVPCGTCQPGANPVSALPNPEDGHVAQC